MTTVLATEALCAPCAPEPGWVAFEDGVITEIGQGRPPTDARHLDDVILAPGFIDLQCNGVGADDLARTDTAGWSRAGAALARAGVTAYCPTLVSAPLDRYATPLQEIAARQRAVPPGEAAVLGAHLEGPFLGAAPGAHPPDLLRAADLEALHGLLDTAPDAVRIMTVAPEADPDQRAIRALVAAGVVVALGHSRCSYDEARVAADAGATVVTHLFNGMSPLHHRDPGLVGAALDDERLTPTLIADGVHVHPVALRLAVACKQQIAVVSDAVAVEGAVVARDGAAYLPDGTLTGAIALVARGIANLVAAGIPVGRAVELGTAVPAAVLGLEDRGRIRAGARADVVALDAETMRVRDVWLGGVRLAHPTPSDGQ